jgi:hypothetical protein
MGIKLFNYLPLNLKKLYKDVKRFKLKLVEFLSRHSFYTLDEYIEYSSWKDWLYTGFYVLKLIISLCFMYLLASITILTLYSVLLILYLYWLFHILDCTGFMEIKMMMMMNSWQAFCINCCYYLQAILGAEYTKAVRCTYSQKSKVLRLEDQAIQFMGFQLPICCSPTVWYRCL